MKRMLSSTSWAYEGEVGGSTEVKLVDLKEICEPEG